MVLPGISDPRRFSVLPHFLLRRPDLPGQLMLRAWPDPRAFHRWPHETRWRPHEPWLERWSMLPVDEELELSRAVSGFWNTVPGELAAIVRRVVPEVATANAEAGLRTALDTLGKAIVARLEREAGSGDLDQVYFDLSTGVGELVRRLLGRADASEIEDLVELGIRSGTGPLAGSGTLPDALARYARARRATIAAMCMMPTTTGVSISSAVVGLSWSSPPASSPWARAGDARATIEVPRRRRPRAREGPGPPKDLDIPSTSSSPPDPLGSCRLPWSVYYPLYRICHRARPGAGRGARPGGGLTRGA